MACILDLIVGELGRDTALSLIGLTSKHRLGMPLAAHASAPPPLRMSGLLILFAYIKPVTFSLMRICPTLAL